MSFGQQIAVPRGKKVTFPGLDSLAGVEMILESDLTIKFVSNYESLLDFNIKGIPKALKDMATGIAGDIFNTDLSTPDTLKQFGFQQWSGSTPVTLSFTIGLYRHKDAYAEVVEPAITLLKIISPHLMGGGALRGPGVTAYDALVKGNGTGISVQAGPCTFNNCIVTSAEPTMSSEIDSFGHPIWIKLNISASTIYTVNDSMWDSVFMPNIIPSSLRKVQVKKDINTVTGKTPLAKTPTKA